MDSSVSQKDEIWFLRVCHHISNTVYQAEELKKVKRKIVVKDFFMGWGEGSK